MVQVQAHCGHGRGALVCLLAFQDSTGHAGGSGKAQSRDTHRICPTTVSPGQNAFNIKARRDYPGILLIPRPLIVLKCECRFWRQYCMGLASK